MLVLSRNAQERIVLKCQDGSRIDVQVLAVDGQRVRLGFSAPPAVRIDRAEVDRRREAEREKPAA